MEPYSARREHVTTTIVSTQAMYPPDQHEVGAVLANKHQHGTETWCVGTSLWYAMLYMMCHRGGVLATHHKGRLWSGTVEQLTLTRRSISDGTSSAGALHGVGSWHSGTHGATSHQLLFMACVRLRPTAGRTASHCRERAYRSSATGSGRP